MMNTDDTITVDASGLSCPQPVLMLRRTIDKLTGGTVEVFVDSGTSRDNCTRAAQKAGWQVRAEERSDGGYRLVLTR